MPPQSIILGEAFISVPNIANITVRLGLLFGIFEFEYRDRGILDLRIGERMRTWLTRLWRGLFAYQVILVAVKR